MRCKEIFAFINQKGGVGKTTIALSVGARLILMGYDVLFGDLDSQRNMTFSLGAKTDVFSGGSSGVNTMFDVLMRKCAAKDAMQFTRATTGTEHGEIVISSSLQLRHDDIAAMLGHDEYRLKEALKPLMDIFDYAVLDTSPYYNIVAKNALTACTGVVVPIVADSYSTNGMYELASDIDEIREKNNPALVVKGLVVNRYHERGLVEQGLMPEIVEGAGILNTKLFTLREAAVTRRAQAKNKDIFAFDPKSEVASDYIKLVNGILG